MKPTFAVLCVTAAMCIGCAGGAGNEAAKPTAAPDSRSNTADGLFRVAQPWTKDVSGAAKSDRSDAIIATLAELGGWGNDNALQTDFSIPIFYADANTPRRTVVGVDEYCGGGPDCDAVPAEMPLPENAYIEGSTDLRCDITGDTEGQGDCHLLVVDKDAGKLYEVYYDTETDLPAFGAVKSGTLSKKLTLVPLAGATVGQSHIRVTATKDDFKKAPSFDTDAELSSEDEVEIYGFYGIGYVPTGQDARRLAKH